MKVGTIVQCVDDRYPESVYKNSFNAPVCGEYYTIREINDFGINRISLLLVEIVNPMVDGTIGGRKVFAEPQWLASRFREVEGLDDLVAELIEESLYEEV
jgi:hypothetical protein